MSTPGDVHWSVFQGTQAEAYETYLVPAIFGPMAAGLVGRAAPRPGERLVDIACGTGIVARTAANRVGNNGRVAGVDLNPTMLEVAARASAGSHPSIEWLEAKAESVPFEDESFDVVLCQQGLQFFPDRPAALREMRRLLAPGGRVLISVWTDVGRGFDALASALGRHISAEAGAALAKGPASLRDGEEISRLMKEAGFSDLSLETVTVQMRFPSAAEFVRRYVNATPLAGAVGQATQAARDQLIEDVAGHLRDLVDANGLRFEGSTNVVAGSRR